MGAKSSRGLPKLSPKTFKFKDCRSADGVNFRTIESTLCSHATDIYVPHQENLLSCKTMNSYLNWNSSVHSKHINHLLTRIDMNSLLGKSGEETLFVYVHNPTDLPRTSAVPTAMKCTSVCGFHFEKTEIRRLEPPYQTNCRKYKPSKISENDLKSTSGVVFSKQMCILNCRKKISLSQCHCLPQDLVVFPEDDHPCFEEGYNFCRSERVTSLLEGCHESCKDDCEEILYKSSVFCQNMAYPLFMTSPRLYIYFGFSPMKSINFRSLPKMTGFEMFGYVGGYTGIWLGISVPMVYDGLERLIIKMKLKFRKL